MIQRSFVANGERNIPRSTEIDKGRAINVKKIIIKMAGIITSGSSDGVTSNPSKKED